MKTMSVWNARILYRKVWKLCVCVCVCVCVWKSSFGIESIDKWSEPYILGMVWVGNSQTHFVLVLS